MTNKQLAELFWNRVEKSDASSCWPWRAGRTGKGYGAYYLNGKTERAHRLAWLLACGPITGNLCVLHKCDNPPCCNPDHLFLGTQGDNAKDRQAKGRTRTRPHNKYKTHCRQGHPFAGSNLHVDPSGQRICRTCNKARTKKQREQKRLTRIASQLGVEP